MNLDDAPFELSTVNLVRPHSILKLEWEVDNPAQPAQELAEEENDHAVIDPNLQRELPPGSHEDSPTKLAVDIILKILALAEDLGEFRDFMRYMFCTDSGSDNEPSPVDDSDDESEASKDAVEVVAGEYQGRLDQ